MTKKEMVKFELFDKSISLNAVIREFEEVGYSREFLDDLKAGFEASGIYSNRNYKVKLLRVDIDE